MFVVLVLLFLKLACPSSAQQHVASVAVGFSTRLRHFSLFGCAKNGASAKYNWGKKAKNSLSLGKACGNFSKQATAVGQVKKLLS